MDMLCKESLKVNRETGISGQSIYYVLTCIATSY